MLSWRASCREKGKGSNSGPCWAGRQLALLMGWVKMRYTARILPRVSLNRACFEQNFQEPHRGRANLVGSSNRWLVSFHPCFVLWGKKRRDSRYVGATFFFQLLLNSWAKKEHNHQQSCRHFTASHAHVQMQCISLSSLTKGDNNQRG